MNNEANLHTAIIKIINGRPTPETLKDLFFDLDFTENTEFFQEDTLQKGYLNEAERVVLEAYNKRNNTKDTISEVVNNQLSSSYYYSYETEITFVSIDTVVVSIAYTTQ